MDISAAQGLAEECDKMAREYEERASRYKLKAIYIRAQIKKYIIVSQALSTVTMKVLKKRPIQNHALIYKKGIPQSRFRGVHALKDIHGWKWMSIVKKENVTIGRKTFIFTQQGEESARDWYNSIKYPTSHNKEELIK